MAIYHNISGQLTQELLAVGEKVRVLAISMANVNASIACLVDVYIEKKLTGKFYIVKNVELPVGATLVFEGNEINFNNNPGQFGLFIKLTKVGSGSGEPAVDVIIS
tara:strand:+ start:901 stop:1218 length:318 start_codon:yes stop_codon:yes gene_type:complete